MWFGRWYGGSSYSVGELSDSLETFASIESAKEALYDRCYSGRYPNTFDYVRGTKHSETPAVDESSEIQLYAYDPWETTDPYPDKRVFFGPRGGVRVENC